MRKYYITLLLSLLFFAAYSQDSIKISMDKFNSLNERNNTVRLLTKNNKDCMEKQEELNKKIDSLNNISDEIEDGYKKIRKKDSLQTAIKEEIKKIQNKKNYDENKNYKKANEELNASIESEIGKIKKKRKSLKQNKAIKDSLLQIDSTLNATIKDRPDTLASRDSITDINEAIEYYEQENKNKKDSITNIITPELEKAREDSTKIADEISQIKDSLTMLITIILIDISEKVNTVTNSTNYSNTKVIDDLIENCKNYKTQYSEYQFFKANIDSILLKLNNFEKLCNAINSANTILNKKYDTLKNNKVIQQLKDADTTTINEKQTQDREFYLNLLNNYKLKTDKANSQILDANICFQEVGYDIRCVEKHIDTTNFQNYPYLKRSLQKIVNKCK